MTGRALAPGWLLGGGKAHKRATLEKLAEQRPDVMWVLVGDDGGHDPRLFAEFARAHPDRIAVIALRQVLGGPRRGSTACHRLAGVAVVEAPNGEELLPRLRASIGLERP